MNLPKQYAWLENEPGPKMIKEALNFYGLKEVVGSKHNDIIVKWGDAIGIGDLVNDDEQAWCGLFMGYVAVRSQKHVPMKGWDILRALKWKAFGKPVTTAMLGDVLIFSRDGGGHVCLYVGEDDTHYHCLGGNQGNSVSITRIAKNRLSAIRRPIYINQPAEVRVIKLAATGLVSVNEA